jgi:hypothetical protein
MDEIGADVCVHRLQPVVSEWTSRLERFAQNEHARVQGRASRAG